MALHSQVNPAKPAAAQQPRRPSVAVCASSVPARTPEARSSVAKATRAPSAYNLYVKEHYQSVSARLKAKGLPADLTNVGKHLRQQWSSLTDREKAPYAARSQKLKEEMAGNRATSPVAARGVARSASAVPARPLSPSPARGQRPATPQPATKPLPPYEAFITEQFPAVKASHPNASAQEITKLIEEMWARVPQAQKDAKTLRYKADLQAFMNGGSSSGASSSRSSPQPVRYTPAPSASSRPASSRPGTPRPQSPRPERSASPVKPLPPKEAFTQEQFTVIKATYPKATTSEISRTIDDMWSKLPQSLKDAKQRRYETDLAAYNAHQSGAGSASRNYSPAPARSSTPTRSSTPSYSSSPASPAPRGSTPRGSSTGAAPLPPFEAFSKEQYIVIKSTNPKTSDSEISRMINDMWSKLPQSLKDAKQKRYESDLATYNATGGAPARGYTPAPARTSTPTRSSTPSYRPASPAPRASTPSAQRGSSTGAAPVPPFEAFAKDQYAVIKSGNAKASDSEINRIIQDCWNKLPQSLKDAKQKRYEADLAAYNANGGSSASSRSGYTPAPARSSAPTRSSTPSYRPASPAPRASTPSAQRGSSTGAAPVPPFEAFAKDQYAVIKSGNAKASDSEINRIIQDCWNKLPQSLKDAKQKRYEADLAAYNATGGAPARGYSPAPARSSTPTRSSTPSYRPSSPAPRASTPSAQRGSSTGAAPVPPFEAFAKDQYAVIKSGNAKASDSEINRIIQDCWSKLPQSLKDAKQKRYEADLAAYNANGGSSASSRSGYTPAPTRSATPTRSSTPSYRPASPAPVSRASTPSAQRGSSSGAAPLPPFESFTKEQYTVIKASHPKASDSEINRLINELWARVPQAQKDAKEKRYHAELALYNAGSNGSSSSARSYSPAPARSSTPSYSSRPASPAPRAATPSGQRGSATPAAPVPPFEAFAKDQYTVIKSGNPKASDSEINRTIQDLWGKLPQSLKDAKQKRYEADLAAYNKSQGGSSYNSASRQTVTVRRSPAASWW